MFSKEDYNASQTGIIFLRMFEASLPKWYKAIIIKAGRSKQRYYNQWIKS